MSILENCGSRPTVVVAEDLRECPLLFADNAPSSMLWLPVLCANRLLPRRKQGNIVVGNLYDKREIVQLETMFSGRIARGGNSIIPTDPPAPLDFHTSIHGAHQKPCTFLFAGVPSARVSVARWWRLWGVGRIHPPRRHTDWVRTRYAA